MKTFAEDNGDYMKTLSDRAKKSRVYSQHQMIGLQVAEILQDPGHKSLYIRLAKDNDSQRVIMLAKNVADNKLVKNKGAYFMSLFYKKEKDEKNIGRLGY